MIKVESFLKDLLKHTRVFEAPKEKALLYAITKQIISCYFKEFDFCIYENIKVKSLKHPDYSVAALRAQMEKYHSKRIHIFLENLKTQSSHILHRYKENLARVARYSFQSSPVSHLKYGLKTAESFYWKMCHFAQLNNIHKGCIDRLARLLASQSLEVLLLLDGLLWDKLQFSIPRELKATEGNLLISSEKAELILSKASITACGYGPIGCPALSVRVAGRPLLDLISDAVWEKVSQYFDR